MPKIFILYGHSKNNRFTSCTVYPLNGQGNLYVSSPPSPRPMALGGSIGCIWLRGDIGLGGGGGGRTLLADDTANQTVMTTAIVKNVWKTQNIVQILCTNI